MKLRLQPNSLRLRLSTRDTERLERDGVVRETICLAPGQSLAYEVALSAEVQLPTAVLEGGTLSVRLPRVPALAWLGSDEEGMRAEQPTGKEPLTIRVEKDYACLHRAPEPGEEHAYPNPARR